MIQPLISWFNKNRGFDKSTGEFKTPDLFTFLENIYEFEYTTQKIYDDVYFILKYIQKSTLFLLDNLNSNIKRKSELIHISKAKNFDKNSVLWLSRQEGITLNEKIKKNKIKALQKYYDYDTYENRLLKLFLKKLLFIIETRDDLKEFDEFIFKTRRFLRSKIAKEINENGYIVYNNLLLHHKHYYKIYKSYKWLNSINEKEEFFNTNYKKILNKIFQFEVLSKLQYNTYIKVFPKNLQWNKFWDINLNEFLFKKYINHLIFNQRFEQIPKKSLNFIEKSMHLSLVDKYFTIKQNSQNIFIDMFRLFPIAKIEDKIIEFPIFVKQKDENIIVNANNTKVIDLNKEFFTLPEILKTYDLKILTLFLEDFKKYFKSEEINYILPDYIETFKFTNAKKLINNYFKGRNIPKSVLAGLNYIFKNQVRRNDILIYIQKNHENELFVTPLLIDFDKNLLAITNGLFIKRYPTKKIKKSEDIINYLKKIFDKKTAHKILNKTLQSGIKALYQNKTAFFYKNRFVYFDTIEFINPSNVKEEEVKQLYNNAIFENKTYKEIKDDKFKNLEIFEKVVAYENRGYKLWKDFIPKLSLEVLNEDGIYEEFILIDEKNNNDEIFIKKHFIIPANVKEISLPLVLEGVDIGFEAYITSEEMPFKENVECELKLTYNYELENPFTLIFYPLKKYKPLKVKWREKKIKKLPFPDYPSKKRWEDFLNDNGSNLPDWILERLELLEIDKVPIYKVEKETQEVVNNIKESFIVSPVLKGKDGKPYVFVKGKNKDILCHQSQFIEDIDIKSLKKGDVLKFFLPPFKNTAKYIHINYLDIEKVKKNIFEKIKIQHENMSFEEKTKDITKAIHSIRVPLLKMWSNISLNDEFVPNDFRKQINYYKELAFEIMIDKRCDKNLKKELQFFLSAIHEDTLPEFYNYILKVSKKNLYENMALLLGRMNNKWQKKLFKNIINQLPNPLVLTILAIAVWRDKNFINYLIDFTDNILDNLLENLKKSFEMVMNIPSNKYKKILTNNLELLLALLRIREKNPLFLHPQEKRTKEFLKIINQITEYIISNNITLISKIELSLENSSKIPNLLYALNIYLRGDIDMAKSIKIVGVKNENSYNK